MPGTMGNDGAKGEQGKLPRGCRHHRGCSSARSATLMDRIAGGSGGRSNAPEHVLVFRQRVHAPSPLQDIKKPLVFPNMESQGFCRWSEAALYASQKGIGSYVGLRQLKLRVFWSAMTPHCGLSFYSCFHVISIGSGSVAKNVSAVASYSKVSLFIASIVRPHSKPFTSALFLNSIFAYGA